MIFDAFDRIRIINLPHRRDRRNEMDRQLARVGLAGDPRVAYFPAFAPSAPGLFASKGAHGCFLSHLSVLEQAAAAVQSVLVLEDDCDFRMPAVLEYEMPACDVFYGGYIASDPGDLHSSDIMAPILWAFRPARRHCPRPISAPIYRPTSSPIPRRGHRKLACRDRGSTVPLSGSGAVFATLRRSLPISPTNARRARTSESSAGLIAFRFSAQPPVLSGSSESLTPRDTFLTEDCAPGVLTPSRDESRSSAPLRANLLENDLQLPDVRSPPENIFDQFVANQVHFSRKVSDKLSHGRGIGRSCRKETLRNQGDGSVDKVSSLVLTRHG